MNDKKEVNRLDDSSKVPEGTDKIAVRKMMNKWLSEARRNAKPQTCIMCGESQTSFCNSHSVPQMFLKQIADNGKLLLASSLIGFDFEIVDLEAGVNSSGTFNYICNKCDGTFFQDYENIDNIEKSPTDKMLAEIAVKNILLQISKRAMEKQLITIQQRELNLFFNPQDGIDIKNLDMNEYLNELQFHKKIADTNEIGCYQILFWDKLPYKVPIAMQSAIAMTKDMNGNQINNVYDYRDTVRMQYLHLAIFPLNTSSIVLAFYHKRDKLYRGLRHQFNSTSKDKVLKFLNYVVFEYTENYFISKKIQQEIKSNAALQKLSRENNGYPEMGILNISNNFGNGYTPVTHDDIPNFLTQEWAV